MDVSSVLVTRAQLQYGQPPPENHAAAALIRKQAEDRWIVGILICLLVCVLLAEFFIW